jgi:hypothetical protein
MVTKTNALLFRDYTYDQEQELRRIREVLRSDRISQTEKEVYDLQ